MAMVAPSLLSADFYSLGSEVAMVEKSGADYLHIDIMDGHFVPNITIGPGVVKALRKQASILFDVHLMVEHPERYIDSFVDAGADLISVHAEACEHLHRVIKSIKEKRCKSGVAVNPGTSLSCLEWLLNEVDFVLIMSVNPGFGGQKFIPEMVRKVKKLRGMLEEAGAGDALIEVDGGVNKDNAGDLISAGADILVAGSAIFKSSNPSGYIKDLRTLSAK